MKPWERWLNGVAYAAVVVFIVFVGVSLWQNVTADPVVQVQQFEESHDHRYKTLP
jgi:hypothetical protein